MLEVVGRTGAGDKLTGLSLKMCNFSYRFINHNRDDDVVTFSQIHIFYQF